MLKVEIDGVDILVTANGIKFWLSQDEAKSFHGKILRGAWQNSVGAIMHDRYLEIKKNILFIRNGCSDYSIKLSKAEVDLFTEAINEMKPVEITPAANWAMN